MSEKTPAFVVVDRRKFTAEGDIREGYTPPPVEAPVVAPVLSPEASQTAGHARPEAPPPAPTPKVVTMPARSTVEADDLGSAHDSGEDDLAGAGYDVDGGGISSEDEAAFLDENLRGDQEMEAGPPPTTAETAAQDRAYQHASREMDALLSQANPGMKPSAAVGFEHIVQSFYLSAIMAMGAGTEPGQKPRIDIVGARQSIDMLNVLADKTRGNLDDKEQRLVDGVSFELRMMFLELTNAIAAQAQQAPPPGRK